VRRVVALIVVAVIGAGVAGWFWRDSGVAVNNSSVQSAQVRSDLLAISRSPSYACYLNTIVPLDGVTTNYGFSPAGSSNWAQLQVGGLALTDFMVTNYHWDPTSAELAADKVQYEAAMTSSAAAAGVSCPTSAAAALATMPASFVDAQVRYYAASLDFISKISNSIPLDDASLRAFYAQHPENYDTICYKFATVTSANYQQFQVDRASGKSVSWLAANYPGGSGCVSPTQQGYTIVRSQTSGQALNTFPAQPYVPANSSSGFFIAATSRTPNPFESVASLVLADARSVNSAIASQDESTIIAAAHVRIDPAFARWIAASAKTQPLTTPKASLTPFAGVGLT